MNGPCTTSNQARARPIGTIPLGELCDPGLPCYLIRRDPRADGGFVRVQTVPDGYEVRVHESQLAVTPVRLRDRPSAAA